MAVVPFLKWAGGKRWLVERSDFALPSYSGRYIEPFLGSGAVFFHHLPKSAILSDINSRLIETFQVIKADWKAVERELKLHQKLHSPEYYYAERQRKRRTPHTRAGQFLYLNRACWNGLYRENLRGEFNVPIGTKSRILLETDDFAGVSTALQRASIFCCDFEESIDKAVAGDLLFVDPPYTAMHNNNGFVKYNQRIFSWSDQIRLRDALKRARDRNVFVVLTNADHNSIYELYEELGDGRSIERRSIISGLASGRNMTSERLYILV